MMIDTISHAKEIVTNRGMTIYPCPKRIVTLLGRVDRNSNVARSHMRDEDKVFAVIMCPHFHLKSL